MPFSLNVGGEFMGRTLCPLVVLVCVGAVGTNAKAVTPTVTTATATAQQDGTKTVAADGEFPQLAGSPVSLSCELEVRWVKNGQTVLTEPQMGRGTATNGNPTGTFSGSKSGASCSTQGATLQVRVRIKGKYPGDTALSNLTDWSAWKDCN